jgi:hypothetical protein
VNDYTDELEKTVKSFINTPGRISPEDRSFYVLKGYTPVHGGWIKLPEGWSYNQYQYRRRKYAKARAEFRELMEAFTGDPADLIDMEY